MQMSRFVFPRGTLDEFVRDIAGCEDAGFDGVWAPQIFGWDALLALTLAGTRTSRIRLGTAVLPTHPVHPLSMAISAMTAAAAVDGRLTLGVGASHRFIVEGVWGLDYRRSVTRMRAYLTALRAATSGEVVDVDTDMLTARTAKPLELPDVAPPRIVLAGLGPRMVATAGELADGTITWLAGARTLGRRIVPAVSAAADTARRPAPRVIACLPICVTDDERAGRASAREFLSAYADVPSYRALLDEEGVDEPADIALVGTEDRLREAMADLAAAGVTEFCARILGGAESIDRTTAFLTSAAADLRDRK
ncbi:TIGR03564 family F420-dependent LLM class oxidoreductase [Nocardia bovistercoris]|uniref:TIGR03564 family F420-dependent LLM class oxidoreductase n=1 Tax=Nocardia bovistercoris TaxID=2785916 RepID=A0A931I5W0_9NOCA|nr:TIGR03564 family F420-dependent LLM class oxidoreductase [Nocardia bovistercoris]MBH0774776.1 TIGR03564 family F420-dependent LLM class oxidoreductase [Nocardia bovistercoris]